jgi:LacI family transcriptional regulator
VLYARNIGVPGTISVIGFDDTFAAALTPPLTTVAVPMHELGQVAFRCAVAEPRQDRATLGTHLVLRGSTGPPGQVSDMAGKGDVLTGAAK